MRDLSNLTTPVDGSRIVDLTAKSDQTLRKGTRSAQSVYALVLHQMACCAARRDPLNSYLHTISHFAILRDGTILQLHPVTTLLWASNGFNAYSVAVEFAGNLPDTRGKWWEGATYGTDQVTPEQIDAGRYLLLWLQQTIALTHVFAHRQSSGTRDNDPGPDLWSQVGQWGIDQLGLSDGGPGYKIDSGNPIPDAWRNWPESTQPELEQGVAERRLVDYSPQLESHDFESDGTSAEALSDAEQLTLAAELLEVSDERSLDDLLRAVLDKSARSSPRFARSALGRALGGVLKGAARHVLPNVSGVRTRRSPALQLGLELEGLSPEDRDFEAAKGFVRFAGAAVRSALAAPAGRPPLMAAKLAASRAAQRHAPGLLRLPVEPRRLVSDISNTED